MRRFLLMTLMVCAMGCGPLTVQPGQPVTPKPEALPESIFTALADAIDSGKTLPKNTTQLELMLRHLRTVQAITDEQVSAVKAAVDCSKEVPLTKADADKIRGLK